jgi:hypothetical protein
VADGLALAFVAVALVVALAGPAALATLAANGLAGVRGLPMPLRATAQASKAARGFSGHRIGFSLRRRERVHDSKPARKVAHLSTLTLGIFFVGVIASFGALGANLRSQLGSLRVHTPPLLNRLSRCVSLNRPSRQPKLTGNGPRSQPKQTKLEYLVEFDLGQRPSLNAHKIFRP